MRWAKLIRTELISTAVEKSWFLFVNVSQNFLKAARMCVIIQDVNKVSLKFQKFITKANEKTDKWKLLQNVTYIFKFLCLI
jgi:hypothetical protein